MNTLNPAEVTAFVNETIGTFHQKKVQSLESLRLNDLLKRKNPYLFRAKNLTVASDLIQAVLDAFLSSSEEKLFGDFLEGLAIFIAGKTVGGKKSSALGIDLEFVNRDSYYLVSIKSGPNWGNNSQHKKQQADFAEAAKRLKQSSHVRHVQPVLGICYGKTRSTHSHNYLQVVGQNFWYLISENPDLYTEIIEPIGYRAREHNEAFQQEKARQVNLFTEQFIAEFCTDGRIDWDRLVEFNSGNFDLDQLEY